MGQIAAPASLDGLAMMILHQTPRSNHEQARQGPEETPLMLDAMIHGT